MDPFRHYQLQLYRRYEEAEARGAGEDELGDLDFVASQATKLVTTAWQQQEKPHLLVTRRRELANLRDGYLAVADPEPAPARPINRNFSDVLRNAGLDPDTPETPRGSRSVRGRAYFAGDATSGEAQAVARPEPSTPSRAPRAARVLEYADRSDRQSRAPRGRSASPA